MTKLNSFLTKCCFSVMKSSAAGSGSQKLFTKEEVRALMAQAAQQSVMDQGLY
jgi:hypothetical protein